MSVPHYDAIVAGVGGMGSATAYHLARRGQRVLGLERFGIAHDQGSSHGLTRIIRLPYYEHPAYVPLLFRAYELWHELEREAGGQLLVTTGSIDAGPPGSPLFEGASRSARMYDIRHEVLTGAELSRRFPGYRLPPETMALYQPDGGFLMPEACITAHAELAQRHGAEIRMHEPLIGWESRGDGVRVETEQGAYDADRLVIASGAWIGKMLPELAPIAVPERQVVAWLEPRRPEYFRLDNFPVFNLAVEEGRYYGFPSVDGKGFKFGRYHHLEERGDVDAIDRRTHPQDETVLRAFAERYFPDGAGATRQTSACIFTNTPDEHFIVDLHPRHPQVVMLSPCSGHGFKFCSVIGEIAADLAVEGSTRHDISLFKVGREGLSVHA